MGDLFAEQPDDEAQEKPARDLRAFPYFELYKVRNMYFAMDIPVFTALESQSELVQDGHIRFKHVYCCN